MSNPGCSNQAFAANADIDDIYMASIEKDTKAGSGEGSGFESKINKKIYDTLDLSPAELDGNPDAEGCTARDRVIERYKKHLEDPKMYPMGKNFYNMIREKYRAEDSPEKLLKTLAKHCTDEINTELVSAVAKWRAYGNRKDVIEYMQLASSCNRAEAICFAQFALSIKACGSTDLLKMAKDTIDELGRLAIARIHPDVFVHIKTWCDSVIILILQATKGDLRKPKAFVSKQWDICVLVCSADCLTKILNHQGKWIDLQDALIKLVTESLTGAKLFGFAIQSVVAESVDGELKD